MLDPRLLGIISDSLSEDTHYYENVIGGNPLLPACPQKPKCDNCHEEMSFLLRINAPVGEIASTRLLYVFMCCRQTCLNSYPGKCFKALRFHIQDSNADADPANAPSDQSQWHFDVSDDWGDECCEDEVTSPDETVGVAQASGDQSKRLQTPSGSTVTFACCQGGSDTATFEAFYVEVFEDVTSVKKNPKLTAHERFLLQNYCGNEDVDAHIKDLYREASSSTSQMETAGADEEDVNNKLFHKFLKQLSPYPQQIIRYQWNGKPLLAETLPDADEQVQQSSDYSRCASCGQPTVFEFQITPGLFTQLRSSDERAREALLHHTVATVLVFSCAECCWEEGRTSWKEERCVVQSEMSANVVTDETCDDDDEMDS